MLLWVLEYLCEQWTYSRIFLSALQSVTPQIKKEEDGSQPLELVICLRHVLNMQWLRFWDRF